MENKRLSLIDLNIGEHAVISSIEFEDKVLRKRMLDMGLTPGAEVVVIKTAPMGDPLELRVRGYELTIRKANAENIYIRGIHKEHVAICKNTIFNEVAHSQKGETDTYIKRKNNNINADRSLRLALVGNQNCGKTTLFNKLTGLAQKVGNFPGVTVERTDGTIKGFDNVTVTDLPGVYSLSPYSVEEQVTRNFLLDEKPDGIINIVDATNVERNLLLTLQLIELDIPMIIALNMMDEVASGGGSIDVNGLESALGVPVVPISAAKDEGLGELIEHAVNVARYSELPGRLDFCLDIGGKEGAIHRYIHSIIHLIEDHAKAVGLSARFAASAMMENDESIIKKLNLEQREIALCEDITKQMEVESGLDREAAIAGMRFNFIENLCSRFVSKAKETVGYKTSLNIDKILTGKYTALPAFLFIMAVIFYLTFGPVGGTLSEWMESGIKAATSYTDQALKAYGLNIVVNSLIIDGIFAGVGSVLSFLPVIVVLFFFLSILEDTGYMARVAFIMDKLLRKIGLSGRSFVPMLMGFGCSVPAIMAARTLPSARDRKMTILLTPFMSCSAKLPIYALFTAAFFSDRKVEVIIALYMIGVLVGILFALFMKRFIYKGEAVPFVLELPNYRAPVARNVARLIYGKSKDFVQRAFTIIFWAAIIIWFLQTFDMRINLVSDSSYSLLASLGSVMSPVFQPLGISDWRISTAFLTGFIAKESVVSSLTVLLGGDVSKLPEVFTGLTAFVFLTFSLLYTPCIAAVAVVKKELGTKYAFAIIFVQTFIAWIIAFVTYQIGRLL